MPYRPKDPEDYRDEAWLREQYQGKRKSMNVIAEECGCSKETIRRWIHRHGIPTRDMSEAVRLSWEDAPDERREAAAETIREHAQPWWTMDEETQERVRESLSKRMTENNPMEGATGEDNPAWNPDRDAVDFYNTPEWKRTRSEVYERDGWTCRECGAKDEVLHAHHVVPISEGGKPFDLENLITVCKSCHEGIHDRPIA